MLEAIALFAIRRRVLVVGLLAAVLAFGALAAMRLPIDAVPDVSTVQVSVLTEVRRSLADRGRAHRHLPDGDGAQRRAAQLASCAPSRASVSRR